MIIEAQAISGSTGQRAALVRAGLVRNLDIAEKARVPHAGKSREAETFANLELMPRTLNRRKGVKMGSRQWDYLRKFRASDMQLDRAQAPWIFDNHAP